MSDVIDINSKKAHYPILAMCIACKHRWIGIVVAATSLFRLECPTCGAQDSFASFLPIDYMVDAAKT